jgi:hypothetical protein
VSPSPRPRFTPSLFREVSRLGRMAPFGGRSLAALPVASADGFCGLLTAGHRSFLDPWGYRWVRVPPERRAVPASLRLEQYVAVRAPIRRWALGLCVGPCSGKFSGGNKDGPRGVTGTPAASRGRVLHPFHDIPSSSPRPGGRPGLRARVRVVSG